MNIGEAITHMRYGYKVMRTGWNDKGMWIALQTPDEHSKMTLIQPRQHFQTRVSLLPTQPCIRCGFLMEGVKGGKGSVCRRCGWKDDCCITTHT